MNSSIEFRNLTCLDHAWIDAKGMIHGRSYNVSVTVSGKVTDDEHVVLDFSAGKKQIKAIIDDNVMGYDHKLLITPLSKVFISTLGNGYYKLESPHLYAEVPQDCIQHILTPKLDKEISELLKFNFPDLNFNVKITQLGFTTCNSYFRYTHGLKNSTSYGCNNIFHGHTSFVETSDGSFQEEIVRLFDDKVLINKENVVGKTSNSVTIEVDTCQRGKMTATYVRTPYLILDTETTIEYMVQYAAERYKKELKGKSLFISEGLQKGALINVE